MGTDKHYLNILITADEHVAIKQLAKESDLSVSQLLRKVIRKALAEKMNKITQARLDSEFNKLGLE
jgi:hypothetical protein